MNSIKKAAEFINGVVDFYGKDNQVNVCIEELSELIKELCKYKRGIGNLDHITEEMADVYIILLELECIYKNGSLLDDWYDVKMKRLQKRLEADKYTALCEKMRRKSYGRTQDVY